MPLHRNILPATTSAPPTNVSNGATARPMRRDGKLSMEYGGLNNSQKLTNGSSGADGNVCSAMPTTVGHPNFKYNMDHLDANKQGNNGSIIYHRNRGGRPRRNPAKSGLKFHVFTSSQYWQHQDYGRSRIDMAADVVDNPGESYVPHVVPKPNDMPVKTVNSQPYAKVEENRPTPPQVKTEVMDFEDGPSPKNAFREIPPIPVPKFRKVTSRPSIEETIMKMKNELNSSCASKSMVINEDLISKIDEPIWDVHKGSRKRKPTQTRRVVQFDDDDGLEHPKETIEEPIKEEEISIVPKHKFVINSELTKTLNFPPSASKSEPDVNTQTYHSKSLSDYHKQFFEFHAKNGFHHRGSDPFSIENAIPQNFAQVQQISNLKNSYMKPSFDHKANAAPEVASSKPVSLGSVENGLLRKALHPQELHDTKYRIRNSQQNNIQGTSQNFNSSLTSIPVATMAPSQQNMLVLNQHQLQQQQQQQHASRKRKNCRTLVRQQLEATFKKKGFLVQTKQVSSGSATFCKFRQLNKYSRYYLKIWHKHLPDEVHKLWKGFLPPKDRH